MTKSVEDWSKVRSPSRARRRMRQGHPQNIVVRQVPRTDAISIDGGQTYTMHPETAREFRRMVKETSLPVVGAGEVRYEPRFSLWSTPVWGGSIFAPACVT